MQSKQLFSYIKDSEGRDCFCEQLQLSLRNIETPGRDEKAYNI